MSLDLNSLNPSQRDAVVWGKGPLVVLAGPGSGKTRVLTYRIARLLEESSSERFKILGITFTNKAAAEMRSRLEALVTRGRDRALLTTFHSFAAEILRQHGTHIGLRPDFVILTQDADREAILTEILRGIHDTGDAFTSNTKNVLPVLDRLLSECIAPDNAMEALKGHSEGALVGELYRQYREKLVQSNQLDFPSLIAHAVTLLDRFPAVAKQLQRVYQYVCVDEFQDTNAAQYRLLVAILPRDNPNLFVVADDDQVIYQWNGADPKRLEDLSNRFSAKTVQLPENYRCPPGVIRLANQLIAHNTDRSAFKEPLKAIKPNTGGEESLRVIKFKTFDEEVAWIVDELATVPADSRPERTVLARTRKLLDRFVDECGRRHVAAYVVVRKTEFSSAPLSFVHSALRLTNARQDREQLRRVCKAFYSLEGVNLRVEDVVAESSFSSGDYLRSWFDLATKAEGVSPKTREFLDLSRRSLLERQDHWTFIETTFSWLDAIKGAGSVAERAFDEYLEEREVWNLLQKEVIEQYGKAEVTLHSFLQELDLRSKEPPVPQHAVRCFTIHTSKGMEFKHVYLIGLVEDQLPSWSAVKKGDSSLEMCEERRNCFVAITRTQECLTLTFAENYFGYCKAPSRFLKEMGIES